MFNTCVTDEGTSEAVMRSVVVQELTSGKWRTVMEPPVSNDGMSCTDAKAPWQVSFTRREPGVGSRHYRLSWADGYEVPIEVVTRRK